MEEVKKENKFGFLLAVLKVLGIMLAVIVLALGGLYFYVRVILGIDIFGIIRIAKNLGADFDETTIITAPVTETDIEQTFMQFDNAGLNGFYTVSDGKYTIAEDISSLTPATQDIAFTEVQTCVLLQNVLKATFEFNQDIKLDFDVKQIKFSNYVSMANGGKVDVNMIFHTSLKELKSLINTFPVNLFLKFIPDEAYVSLNFSIEQTDDFAYVITPINMSLNSLTTDQTAMIVNVIGSIFDGVNAQSLCKDVGNIAFQILLGSEEGAGLAKEMSVLGINSFAFQQVGNDIKLVFKI